MDDPAQNDLLDVLLAHKGPVLLSGYDNELYNSRLKGWYRKETACYTQTGKRKQEVLWMNYDSEIDGQMDFTDFPEVMP